MSLALLLEDRDAFPVTGETEKALKRLGTDYLDILYLHAPDAKTPVYETLEAADRLVKSGKVLYIGISNYSAWQLAEMMCISGSEQLTPICVTQNIYNVLSRKIEAELVPCARHCGSGIMVYNPLAGGLLTGKYTGMNAVGGRLAWNDMYRRRFLNEANLAAVSTLKAAAEARGISLIELAYRWCTSRDFIDSVLVGVSSAEQLESNLSLCGFEPLDEELEACCEEQWKKVCGIAPDYSR